MTTTDALDTNQVLELMHNGFTREGACLAVVESHTGLQNAWAREMFDALLNHPDVQAAEEDDFWS